MQEPDWTDKKYDRQELSPRKDDVVWVTKKTRGRFGKMDVAQPGDHGIVIGSWTSSMGSFKVSILTADLREVVTTSSCVKVFSMLTDDETWTGIKLEWMDKTYMPIIVMREKQQRRKRRYRGGSIAFTQGAGITYVTSRDGAAVLVSAINSDSKVWLNQDKVHPEDWNAMMTSGAQCHSVRVPEWVARKSALV
jgi:hypothetical protein